MEFSRIGSKSGINYEADFLTYKQLLINLWSKPGAVKLLALWNGIVFGSTDTGTTSGVRSVLETTKAEFDELLEAFDELLEAFDELLEAFDELLEAFDELLEAFDELLEAFDDDVGSDVSEDPTPVPTTDMTAALTTSTPPVISAHSPLPAPPGILAHSPLPAIVAVHNFQSATTTRVQTAPLMAITSSTASITPSIIDSRPSETVTAITPDIATTSTVPAKGATQGQANRNVTPATTTTHAKSKAAKQ
jgi:hypothetical protein